MQDWLSHRARATPDRTALVRASTGETLDFAGLDAMVEDLAGRLVALGVEAGDHLGMVMETRLAAVCTVHAADRIGAVLVPLGDDRTEVELAAGLDAADVTTLVCSAETESTATAAFDGPVCSVDDPSSAGVASLADASPVRVPTAAWDLDDTRLLLFTSGTTGDPKTVRLTQGNLLWSAVASAFRLGLHRRDRWLVALPLHHMGGLSPVLRLPLYGMTVVLQESFDAGRTADNVGSYDVTCVSLVPTMLTRMLDLRGTLADSLRVALLGGAPAPHDLIERCRDFSVPVHPTYGMTETASQVATATPREAFDDVGTVGRPLFWTTVSVRDGDDPVPDGRVGELVVDGPTVSPGYYDDPAATAEAFGPDGFRTGDVGYLDDAGRLHVVGRVDDQIITGGENVHPREVAEALRAHPGVADAAVVGVPDDEWGELVGALVVAGDDDLTVDALEDHCRQRLAGFKLPRAVAFADELPRTDSGTVDRGAVRRRLLEGVSRADVTVPADPDPPGATGDRATPGGAAAAGDDGRGAADAAGRPEDGDADAADGAAADATGPGGREGETYLVGGSDWSPGEPTPAEETDAPDPVEQTDPVDPGDEGEPETPDFVREVLPDDEPVPADAADAGDDETGAAGGGDPPDGAGFLGDDVATGDAGDAGDGAGAPPDGDGAAADAETGAASEDAEGPPDDETPRAAESDADADGDGNGDGDEGVDDADAADSA